MKSKAPSDSELLQRAGLRRQEAQLCQPLPHRWTPLSASRSGLSPASFPFTSSEGLLTDTGRSLRPKLLLQPDPFLARPQSSQQARTGHRVQAELQGVWAVMLGKAPKPGICPLSDFLPLTEEACGHTRGTSFRLFLFLEGRQIYLALPLRSYFQYRFEKLKARRKGQLEVDMSKPGTRGPSECSHLLLLSMLGPEDSVQQQAAELRAAHREERGETPRVTSVQVPPSSWS